MEKDCDSVSEKGEKCIKKDQLASLQKVCLVCGDKALGFNFNAITCESCKAFFRRNALASKEYKCPFTNNCDITVVTRRFCQKCRLEKCLGVGMVKEFIMSDEDKKEKRKKIEENRAKKRKLPDVGEDPVSSTRSKREDDITSTYTPNCSDIGVQLDILHSSSDSPTSTVRSPSSTIRSPISSELDSSIHSPPVYNQYAPESSANYSYTAYSEDSSSRYVEVYPMSDKSVQYEQSVDTYDLDSNTVLEQQESCIKSVLLKKDISVNTEDPPTSLDQQPEIVHILENVDKLESTSMVSILYEAIKLEFEAHSSINSFNKSSRELNEVERAKLNELIVANKALHAPLDDDVTELFAHCAANKNGETNHDPALITIVNLTAVAIRRLIKLAKKITAFKNMCEEDQVALLKGGCLEMMVLRSTLNYDETNGSWMLPNAQGKFDKIRTEVLKLAKGNIYQVHENFMRTFDNKWREDENIILIMLAILLFTPDRARVVHKDVVTLEQNSYYYLLRRYLESIYVGCEAKSVFLKLIQKILELHKLCDVVTGVILDVNPIEPLLMEMFDLNHHRIKAVTICMYYTPEFFDRLLRQAQVKKQLKHNF